MDLTHEFDRLTPKFHVSTRNSATKKKVAPPPRPPPPGKKRRQLNSPFHRRRFRSRKAPCKCRHPKSSTTPIFSRVLSRHSHLLLITLLLSLYTCFYNDSLNLLSIT